jgi:arylsulfatase
MRPRIPFFAALALCAACSSGDDAADTEPLAIDLLARGALERVEERTAIRPEPELQWGELSRPGWLPHTEHDPVGGAHVWSDRARVAVMLPAVGPGERELVLRAWIGGEERTAEAKVRLNGTLLGTVTLDTKPGVRRIVGPAPAWGRGRNLLELEVDTGALHRGPDGRYRGIALGEVRYGTERRVTRDAATGSLRMDPGTAVRVTATTAGRPGRVVVRPASEAGGRLSVGFLHLDPRTGERRADDLPPATFDVDADTRDAVVPLPRAATPVVVELAWDGSRPCTIAGLELVEPEPAPRPSIVFISIDTLAARHTSLYGYPRETTPRLAAFAEQSTVFERCASNAPWTAPSYMAAMTGVYSSSFRMDLEGGTKGEGSPYLHKLPESRLTVAEALRARGYRTAGFFDVLLLGARFGFGQGFERYDDSAARIDATDPTGGLRHIVPNALSWLDEREGDEPYFLFVHAYDVHGPYLPDAPWRGRFADGDGERELPAGALTHSFGAIPEYIARGEVPEGDIPRHLPVAPIVAAYDEEILALDDALGELLDGLRERGVLDEAYVIVSADHGESTDDHAYFGHGLLYEEVLHVPLVVHVPGGTGRRVATSVQLVDLAPTVFELTGVGDASAWVHGRSLAPLLRGADLPAAPTFAEGGVMRQAAVELDGWKLIEMYPAEEALPQTMLSNPRLDAEWLAENAPEVGDGPIDYATILALIQRFGDAMPFARELQAQLPGPVHELYHLPSDPLELRDLSAEQPDRVAELLAHLRAAQQRREEARQAGAETRVVLNASDLAELSKLGYVDDE